jgi:mono/diheme cytochrome c family protein
MRRVAAVALSALVFAFAGTAAAQPGAPPPLELKPVRPGSAPPNTYPKEVVERGKMLVLSGACNDCHTPWRFDPELGMPAVDWSRMLSGHPEGAPDPEGELGPGDAAVIGPTSTSFKLAFGTTYATNLTPDVDTGIGAWTEKMFVDVFRKGRHLGGDGRPVYPPMVWDWVRSLPDEDLKAMFAYLRSIPPLRNMAASEKVPPPVADMIIALNEKIIALQKDPAAKLEKAPPGPRPPALSLAPVQPGKSPGRKYSASLVAKGRSVIEAGFCHVCHTPSTFNETLGVPAPDFTRAMSGHPAGAPDPQGKLGPRDMAIIGPTFTSFALPFGITYSRNLTPDRDTGIGDWTEEKFLAVFRNGKTGSGRAVLPPMPWHMASHRSDADLKAAFAYLQTLPPIRNPVPAPKVPPAVLQAVAKANDVTLKRGR